MSSINMGGVFTTVILSVTKMIWVDTCLVENHFYISQETVHCCSRVKTSEHIDAQYNNKFSAKLASIDFPSPLVYYSPQH